MINDPVLLCSLSEKVHRLSTDWFGISSEKNSPKLPKFRVFFFQRGPLVLSDKSDRKFSSDIHLKKVLDRQTKWLDQIKGKSRLWIKFIKSPNTSNFVKNTPLRFVFSTLLSVFGYSDEALSLVFNKLPEKGACWTNWMTRSNSMRTQAPNQNHRILGGFDWYCR